MAVQGQSDCRDKESRAGPDGSPPPGGLAGPSGSPQPGGPQEDRERQGGEGGAARRRAVSLGRREEGRQAGRGGFRRLKLTGSAFWLIIKASRAALGNP